MTNDANALCKELTLQLRQQMPHAPWKVSYNTAQCTFEIERGIIYRYVDSAVIMSQRPFWLPSLRCSPTCTCVLSHEIVTQYRQLGDLDGMISAIIDKTCRSAVMV